MKPLQGSRAEIAPGIGFLYHPSCDTDSAGKGLPGDLGLEMVDLLLCDDEEADGIVRDQILQEGLTQLQGFPDITQLGSRPTQESSPLRIMFLRPQESHSILGTEASKLFRQPLGL